MPILNSARQAVTHRTLLKIYEKCTRPRILASAGKHKMKTQMSVCVFSWEKRFTNCRLVLLHHQLEAQVDCVVNSNLSILIGEDDAAQARRIKGILFIDYKI